MIIGITGFARSGKDTVADYLVSEYDFEKYAFADPIKHGLACMFGFSREQLWGDLKDRIDRNYGVSPRDMLQYFGTDIAQFGLPNNYLGFHIAVGRSMWARRFEVMYEKYPKNYVISDIRFPHEEAMIHRLGGVIWRVDRREANPLYNKSSIYLHKSERDILDINIDLIIDNNLELEDLMFNADLAFKSLEKGI